ncbi:NAD(P)/FAD-dependent oxidoreductase [Pelagibacterium xiamenense]|uniref:NAD(P)/FAD-dependent oxidoreductase n=1 Tax=Pelagibacterium xiamenense TaxID=2901140 RepID=UPI001E6221AF|nr:FAD-dependent oxidoreductase [Pelagibacterium xiamenense]MCD7059336.1 FAD-dependent oxidoreductase [Pelagibacterium xiamenense]
MTSRDIVVIGAGVVGLSVALALQARGRDVTVIDRTGPGAGASAGNAGAFAFSDIIPLATPGIMRKAPKWLIDPLGPLSVPPQYALKITPWLLRFWRASWPDRYAAAVTAQSALMQLSRDALARQITAYGLEGMIRREGQLQLYEGAREFEASMPGWQLRKEAGIAFEHLEGPETIARVQPGIAARFTHAGYTPDWMNVTDPLVWTRTLADRFVAGGGAVETASVRGIAADGGAARIETDAGEIASGHVVVSAGAWSRQLARQLGHDVPLETERGYNTTLPEGAFPLKTHLTFGGHGFVVTRIGKGVRVGGAVELGGLDLPPNYKRAEAMLTKAAGFLPDLKTGGGTQWMGFRPSMPDSLPVISSAPGVDGVTYAFGHGHLGLTQSAGTGELVAQMVCGETPNIDMAPFRADRF